MAPPVVESFPNECGASCERLAPLGPETLTLNVLRQSLPTCRWRVAPVHWRSSVGAFADQRSSVCSCDPYLSTGSVTTGWRRLSYPARSSQIPPRMLRKQVTPRGRRLRAFREIVRVG